MVPSLPEIFSSIMQTMLETVCAVICAILPESPFVYYIEHLSMNAQYLKYINYFLPVADFIAILETWTTAIVFYYLWQLIMKILQSVSGVAGSGGVTGGGTGGAG